MGVVLLVASISMLCACLLLIVKLLNSSLRGRVVSAARTVINAELPGRARFLAGYLAMFAGAVLTVVVQSSSVFTSTLTPLVGVGVISIERVYPLCLGSNVGTTTTGLLAALASPSVCFRAAFQIAICHLLFNFTGICLFYPLPASRLPIRLAKTLGATTARYRWFAVVYLAVMFFVMPLMVFGLSAAGHGILPAALAVVGATAVCAGTLTAFQRHRPECLPAALRSWDWLPEWMRSLEPADRLIVAAVALVRRTCCCRWQRAEKTSATGSATAEQSATTADATAGRRLRSDGNQATSTTASLLSWIPLLKHGDGESGYASVATTPAPSRFPSYHAFLHVADDVNDDDAR